MPWRVFVDGEVLTGAYVNDYLAEQARPIVTSSTRPAPAIEGMHIIETDTDLTVDYDGTTWVPTGQNKAWTSYTPTISTNGGTAPSINNGTISGRWRYLAYKTVYLTWAVTWGSTSTFGTAGVAWELSLPAGIVGATTPTTMQMGAARATDAGNAFYVGVVVVGSGASDAAFYFTGGGTAGSGPTVPFTWGSGDSMAGSMTLGIA